MDEITYHKADQKNLQMLIDLRVEFLIDFQGEQTTKSINELKKYLRQYLTKSLNTACIFYIARVGKIGVGVGGILIREQPGSFKNPTGKVGYIVNMYTLPSYRRKGICTKILNLLIDDAKDFGITLFQLNASKLGEPVYQKNGFEMHNEPTYQKRINID